MSFLSVIKTIGTDIGIGVKAVAPLAPTLEAIPGFGSIFGLVFNAVVAVEGLIQAPGSGTAKKTAASSIVTGALPAIDPAALAELIDAIVAILNTMQQTSAKAAALSPVPAK